MFSLRIERDGCVRFVFSPTRLRQIAVSWKDPLDFLRYLMEFAQLSVPIVLVHVGRVCFSVSPLFVSFTTSFVNDFETT